MRKYSLIIEEHNTTPLTISINWNGLQRLSEVLPNGKGGVGDDTFCEFWGTSLRYYADIRKWEKVSKYIFERIEKDTRFVQNILRQSVTLGEKLQKLVQDFHDRDLTRTSNKDLQQYIYRIFEDGGKFCAFGFIPVVCDLKTFYLSTAANTIMQSRVTTCQKYGKSVADVLTLLTTPSLWYPSDVAKDTLRRSKASDYGTWLAKWYWIIFGHLGPGITKKTLPQFIRHEVRGKNVAAAKRRLYKEQKQWEKRLRFTPRERRIMEAMRTFVYIKGYRAEVLHGLYACVQRMLPVVSARTHITRELLLYTHPSELHDVLKRPVLSAKTLRARRTYSLWVAHTPKSASISTGNIARRYCVSHTLAKKAVEKTNILHGQVAYPGKVTGRVLVVNSVVDMKKVHGSFILIAAQTTPELLPAMKKAKAFVTDIGGVTCHAAIVAREMKKPCVIGTKIATEVFKDGDMVEVDANNGVVKLL